MTDHLRIDKQKSEIYFIFISLLLHILAMLMVRHTQSIFKSNDIQTDLSRIEIIPVENVLPESKSKKAKQIAETEKTIKSEKTSADAYLSEQTQQVERQTKASTTAAFRAHQTGGHQTVEKVDQTKQRELSKIGLKVDYKPLGNIGPDQPQISSATNDYLKNIKDGAQTLLNTKEFAYYSFYQRVRKQLEQYWEPGLHRKLKSMFDRGRQLASDREHSTKLLVVLDSEGTITKILVEDTAGVMDLDQAAVDAFNKAGPFPNPPKGMIDSDGTVKVEWEFVLKT